MSNYVIKKLKTGLFHFLLDYEEIVDFDKFVHSMLRILQETLGVDETVIWQRIGENLYTYRYSSSPGSDSISKAFQFNHDENFIVHKENGSIWLFKPKGDFQKILIEIKGMKDFAGQPPDWFEKIYETCSEVFFYGKKLHKQQMIKEKYNQLFLMTDQLYSIMKEEEVLKKLYYTIKSVYPEVLCRLILPNENQLENEIPVKSLEEELNANEMAMTAFLKGEIFGCKKEEGHFFYVPIAGKQGVYGLIELDVTFQDGTILSEMPIIEKVGKAGGKALENAKLYEQSQKHVNDLQLINETTHEINKNLRISDTIRYMVKRMIHSFAADEAAFLLIDDNQKWSMLPESTDFFHTSESELYIEWIVESITEKKGVFIGDLTNVLSKKIPYKSVMAIPMNNKEKIIGFAVVLGKEPYAFTFDMFKLMESLVSHSTLALINSKLREELETLVITDQLTKLYTRTYLDESIQKSFQKDQRGVFILVDVDNFKTINDTFGHQKGDEVLVQIAKTLKQNVREEDICARWGGEELAVYLPGMDIENGNRIANRLVRAVQKSTNPPATVSCGVSYWDIQRGKDSAQKLFKRADDALYRAKNNGKNQTIIQDIC